VTCRQETAGVITSEMHLRELKGASSRVRDVASPLASTSEELARRNAKSIRNSHGTAYYPAKQCFRDVQDSQQGRTHKIPNSQIHQGLHTGRHTVHDEL